MFGLKKNFGKLLSGQRGGIFDQGTDLGGGINPDVPQDALGSVLGQSQQAQPDYEPSTMDRLGAVGGLLLANTGSPVGGHLLNSFQQKQTRHQDALAAQQAAQAKRQAQREDFIFEHDYKNANPEAAKPTSLQNNYQWLQQNHPEQAQNFLDRMTNNYEYRQGRDGRFYRIDIAEPPKAPVGQLRPVGKLSPVGGGGSNATGGF